MGTPSPNELLPLYSREEITPEQAVGYILQNLARMERTLEALRRDIERLKAFTGMEERKR